MTKSGLIGLALLLGALCTPLSAKEDLSPLLETVRSEQGAIALAGAIVRSDGTITLSIAGKRKSTDPTPAEVADAFHIGSCGKAMTATVIAILVEQGKLRWEQTIAESFPEWADEIRPDYHEVTLEQLLTMNGRIVGEVPPDLWMQLRFNTGGWTPSEQREKLLRGVLAAEPVEPGTYSNASFTIAGVMAERATGETWENLMGTKLFEPLGMKSAGFGPPGSENSVSQPSGHTRGLLGGRAPVFLDNPAAIAPAGTMHFSMEDWAKFVAVHLAGKDAPSIGLSGRAIGRLQTPVGESEMAMGWIVQNRPWGGKVLTFTGSNTFWYAVVWIAPQKDRAFLAATNDGSDKAFAACDAAIVAMLRREGLLE